MSRIHVPGAEDLTDDYLKTLVTEQTETFVNSSRKALRWDRARKVLGFAALFTIVGLGAAIATSASTETDVALGSGVAIEALAFLGAEQVYETSMSSLLGPLRDVVGAFETSNIDPPTWTDTNRFTLSTVQQEFRD